MSDLQCAATLLLARHGEADHETALLSDSGGTLTARGREQSRALGRSLRSAHLAAIYSGNLSRAVQTAEIVAAETGVPLTVREQLAWSVAELEAIADLHRGETVLVVSHTGVVQTGVRPLVGLCDAATEGPQLANCGVVEVAVDGDGWAVRTWAG